MIMTEAEITQRKAALRKEVLARRAALDAAIRAQNSASITALLLGGAAFRAAQRVLAYMSFGAEFDTSALIAAILSAGKSLQLPKVNKALHRLDLYEVRDPASDLAAGVWGIREPIPERCVPAQESPDMVIVPGVAFNRAGERLGYGGGYYDRLLAALYPKPLLLAPAFSVQVVEVIPRTSSDIAMDVVITETEVFGPHAERLARSLA